jgi:hypothetical protein
MRSYLTAEATMANTFTYEWSSGADVGSRRASLERLDKLSKLLDIAFLVPGTSIRCGVEAILRLVPGFGDIALILIRMIGNVLVEGMAGTVPIAGDLFDVGWRANRRNVRLLREYFEREGLL